MASLESCRVLHFSISPMLRVCALVLVRPPYRQTSDEHSRVGGNLRISEMEKQVELGIPAGVPPYQPVHTPDIGTRASATLPHPNRKKRTPIVTRATASPNAAMALGGAVASISTSGSGSGSTARLASFTAFLAIGRRHRPRPQDIN